MNISGSRLYEQLRTPDFRRSIANFAYVLVRLVAECSEQRMNEKNTWKTHWKTLRTCLILQKFPALRASFELLFHQKYKPRHRPLEAIASLRNVFASNAEYLHRCSRPWSGPTWNTQKVGKRPRKRKKREKTCAKRKVFRKFFSHNNAKTTRKQRKRFLVYVNGSITRWGGISDAAHSRSRIRGRPKKCV